MTISANIFCCYIFLVLFGSTIGSIASFKMSIEIKKNAPSQSLCLIIGITNERCEYSCGKFKMCDGVRFVYNSSVIGECPSNQSYFLSDLCGTQPPRFLDGNMIPCWIYDCQTQVFKTQDPLGYSTVFFSFGIFLFVLTSLCLLGLLTKYFYQDKRELVPSLEIP